MKRKNRTLMKRDPSNGIHLTTDESSGEKDATKIPTLETDSRESNQENDKKVVDSNQEQNEESKTKKEENDESVEGLETEKKRFPEGRRRLDVDGESETGGGAPKKKTIDSKVRVMESQEMDDETVELETGGGEPKKTLKIDSKVRVLNGQNMESEESLVEERRNILINAQSDSLFYVNMDDEKDTGCIEK
eukprot:UN24325